MTCKILLPVDGSEGSARAARHVADMVHKVHAMEVHLINIQPTGDDWMVRRMIKPAELAKMEEQWSETALSPAREILQSAGIRFSEHTAQGEVAQTIVKQAMELGCDQIVMGTRGLTTFGDLLMGSIARKVLHLTQIPVTLVK